MHLVFSEIFLMQDLPETSELAENILILRYVWQI